MTLAEKILARASGRPKVEPGEYVTAKIDLAVLNEGLALVMMNLKTAGLKNVWDPDKIVVALDHFIPANSERTAAIHQAIRTGVKEMGLKHYYGEKAGVLHQIVVENGHALPGNLVVGTDSHTCTYGALGAARPAASAFPKWPTSWPPEHCGSACRKPLGLSLRERWSRPCLPRMSS